MAEQAWSKMARDVRRVGIVGFGSLGENLLSPLFLYSLFYLGQYLFEEVSKLSGYEVVFVWNRTIEKMKNKVPDHLILTDLAQCHSK